MRSVTVSVDGQTRGELRSESIRDDAEVRCLAIFIESRDLDLGLNSHPQQQRFLAFHLVVTR